VREAWSQGWRRRRSIPLDPESASDSLTAVLTPAGHDADTVRKIAEERYGVALGRGLGALQGRACSASATWATLNEPMLLGALGAIELALAEVGHAARARRGGGGDGFAAARPPSPASLPSRNGKSGSDPDVLFVASLCVMQAALAVRPGQPSGTRRWSARIAASPRSTRIRSCAIRISWRRKLCSRPGNFARDYAGSRLVIDSAAATFAPTS
jgi:hypothetical protein